ncbi:type II secretion system protein J [Verrucomicrobiota bacterium]
MKQISKHVLRDSRSEIRDALHASRFTLHASAFTLLELMLAITILALVSTVVYMTFSTVTSAWKQGMVLTEDIHHGDFVMEQFAAGLSSAYFPDIKGGSEKYGFQLEDDGAGRYSSDSVSWVKLGSALVGADWKFANTPHRVKVSLDENEEGEQAVTVSAWCVYGQPEDFDPDEDEDVKTFYLSTRVTGINCEPCDPDPELKGEIEWIEEWDPSNKVPTHVSITLYMEPVAEGKEPVELKRIVEIPVAPLSWR